MNTYDNQICNLSAMQLPEIPAKNLILLVGDHTGFWYTLFFTVCQ